jgi:DNA-binding MarR family transcriptional regulator
MSRAASLTRRNQPASDSPATIPQVHRVVSHLARRFHQVCTGVLSEVTELEGLTPLEYAALVAVDEAPGIDQRALARRLAVDPVSAGQLLMRLEAAGLAARHVNPHDRRARALTVTSAGAALRAHLRPRLRDAHRRILAPLTVTEQSQLIDMLMRIIERNEPYARPGNGRRRPTRTKPVR